MQYSVIQNTDTRVSRISFGTASLHHLYSARHRQRMLGAAASAGISHFDTSPYYGYGLAETDIGVFTHGRRDCFSVATKVGFYPLGGAAHGAFDVWVRKAAGKVYPRLSVPEVDWRIRYAARSLNDSLRRLKTDYVDFVFLHEPDIRLVNADEFLGWLEAERSNGKVRHWGLAGLPSLLKPWLQSAHPLTMVLQTRDDLVNRTAEFVLESGRDLQFTYGYLSARPEGSPDKSAIDVIRNALRRNTQGSILVSTRRTDRIEQLARLGQ